MDNRTEKRKLGDIGENIVCEFLKKRGFEIIERNYLKKWGEIDIIARKDGVIRFVEVKSVKKHVSHVTSSHSSEEVGYRAEDNMHPWKLRRLSRTIQTYLLEKDLECDWQLDLATVQVDTAKRIGHVELLENIII